MATYSTKQQKAVLACMAAFGERAVSAGEIVRALQESGESVGVATLYRQLEKLERSGSVHKISTDEGAYYQYCPSHAEHDCFLIKCEKCGRIEHMACHNLSPLYAHLAADHRFAVNPKKTMFFGLCALCQEAV